MKRLAFALAAALAVSLPAAADGRRTLGLQVDAGGPQGLGASLVVRPLSFLRLHAGGTTDLVAPGIRGGVTIYVPWYIGPSLTAEAGYQWPGNFNRLAQMFSGTDPKNALLDRVGYRYGSLLGGLDLGGPNRFVVSLRAGMTRIEGETSGLPAFLAGQFSGATVRAGSEASVRLVVPTASIGLTLYVY